MKNTFGTFLKQKRQENSLTQKQLAEILFVSESAVSKWEKDISHPDITLLPKLSKILNVTEHELITASVDLKSREEKIQAKKWRTLSFSWNLFFYITYAIALIPCFICDLAINKTLSWFWIVFSALLLAFTFTNLPTIIKKHKLLILPASMYAALVFLLGVCAIYTNGDWFIIPVIAVLLALTIIFVPIYISKYEVFSKIKKYNDFVSVFVDFVILNILLIIIDTYCFNNGYSSTHWFWSIALPITTIIYFILNLFLSVRFFKINKFLKTSIIMFLSDLFLYIIPLFIKVKNPHIQREINSLNVFKANFSNWNIETMLEINIHCIVFLTILLLAIIFLVVGLIRYFKHKQMLNKKTPY